MSFRLRFILRLIRWLKGPRLDITKEYRGEYWVWPSEVELSVVENARYGYFLVLERFRPIFSTDLWKHCRRNKWSAVMGAQIYNVKRPLRRWQRFSIVTKPLSWDEKWFYFEQRIESNGKLICSAVISVIFLGKDRKIPPAEVLNLVNISTPSPTLSASVRKFVSASELLQE